MYTRRCVPVRAIVRNKPSYHLHRPWYTRYLVFEDHTTRHGGEDDQLRLSPADRARLARCDRAIRRLRARLRDGRLLLCL